MRNALLLVALLVSSMPLVAQEAVRPWDGAKWVWDQRDANVVTQNDVPRYLRRTFELGAKATKASLWISADNRYVVYVNGKKIGAGKAWQSPGQYEVAADLVVGKNLLAIQATNEGGVAGVIAWLSVTTADKKSLVAGTDEKTLITITPGKDWTDVVANDTNWFPAIPLGDATIAPWNLAGGTKTARGGKGIGGFDYGVNAVDPKVTKRLSAEDQLKHFSFPEGFELELVAADPIVINPITLASDEKGRIYVSESHTYRYGPSGSPVKPFANPVVRLERGADGKLQRTVVADGFADPVMGIAIKNRELWLTACNFLYRYDLSEDGTATNKRTIVTDKNKAWNPFGMFVLEWGIDGLLYMSVGNHSIDLHGPDGKLGGRGSSGIVMRMTPDGGKMERLVHGLRVPYSFEHDPFGQLWVLSNGEGNPDRFVRVIDGVDYHCYSRGAVDNAWLAGNHPLAPPVFELGRGAHTQLLRYYGANFPPSYQGSLLLDNWGAHGFAGMNRAIFRFVPNERGDIVTKETLLSCTDPHFRPSHILLDTDGSLLVADWYGRDDESDMTGRIWRLKYVRKDHPGLAHRLDSPEWSKTEYATAALCSPDHLVRQKALDMLIALGPKGIAPLAERAKSFDALGAAHALWALVRIGTPEAKAAVAAGVEHTDWKVRRLALNLLRRHQVPTTADIARKASEDEDPAVRVEAALALPGAQIAASLVSALEFGAAKDAHLRYEAAWHVAKNGDGKTIESLLRSASPEVQLAGLIAIDVACFEDFPTKPAALASLRGALENPGKLDLANLLTVAHLDGDASIAPGLLKLIARDDVPASVSAKAILVLRSRAGGLPPGALAAAGKRLVTAVKEGTLRISTPADQLALFDYLASEGPTPFALGQIGGQLHARRADVREAAHRLARSFGDKSASLAPALWTGVREPKSKLEDAVVDLGTAARVEKTPSADEWTSLLKHSNPLMRVEAVRWWRSFKDRPEMVETLKRHVPELLKENPELREDLASVFAEIAPNAVKEFDLPTPIADKDELTKRTLTALAALSPTDRAKRAALGQQVFERAACTKCHTTATATTLLAPSLKGIAGQKTEYLVESVLFPSKVIKTGFESESIVTTSGKVLSGLVKDEGDAFRVLNLDQDVRVPKTEVESRSVSRVSIMPEGQELRMSSRELVDLVAYLATLK